MLHGFRWQFVALVVSIVVFGLVLVVRIGNRPDLPAPTATLAPQAPSATPTRAPSATPRPTTSADSVQATPTDRILTYTEGLVGEVQRLNPLLAGLNSAEQDVTALIYEGLTTINTYGEAVGLLAEDWVQSRDGLEYVFRLRQDVLWHDGLPFTADDVVFTLSLLGDPEFPGLPDVQRFWQTVEIEKIGEYLVRFRLAQPLASFPSKLTVGLLPAHALQGIRAAQLPHLAFNLTPIGTGPYQLEALRSSSAGQRIDGIDLRLAPVYRQRPEGEAYAIERVRFRLYSTWEGAVQALANGSIHGLAAPEMQNRRDLLRLADVNVYTAVASRVGMLLFNWEQGDETRFFADQRVRTALQTALNRHTPVESNLVNQAIVADSPLLFTSWAYDASLQWPATDLARASELLDSANIQLPEEQELASYSFNILVPEQPTLVRLAQEIATQWSQLPITVTVEAVSPQEHQQRLDEGAFDAAIVELPLGADPDVYAYWHAGQYPDGENYGGVADDRLSDVLERARRDGNGLNRIQLYREFQQFFVTRAIAIPLYYPLFTYAVHETIEGVQLGFIGAAQHRFRTLSDWRIIPPDG